ncbi:uroporphyrinogen-III synthase [Enterococcus pallens]|uniref:uroporphyrinogen-III synthase n=1 Tax=Enterococcus pallens TaxID=160454 RepID=UPI00247FB3F9|nr:uroporphyrinogen-III synthase [Enterococcus pallens]
MGYQTRVLPLTSIQTLPLAGEELQQLRLSSWLFFTSQAAVPTVLAQVLPGINVAVIGQKTAEAVRRMGVEPAFISSKETKREMVKEWRMLYPQPTTIFYPKSQLADNLLEQMLEDTYQVHSFVAYQNLFLPDNQIKLDDLLRKAAVQSVYFTSPSAWRRFYSVYQHYYLPLELIAIGETTKQAIEKTGCKATLIEKYTAVNENGQI